MKAIMQNFTGRTAEWEAANPVLYKGVLAVEEKEDGSRRVKIGDGITPWKRLKALGYGDIAGLPEGIAAAAESEGRRLMEDGISLGILHEAKGYADDALEAAKSYTDEAIESEWVAVNGETGGFDGTAVLQINFQAKLLSIHLHGEAYGYGPPSAVINFHADELEDVAFKDIGQGYNAAVQAIPAINRGYIAGIIWGRIQKNGPSLSVEINVFNEQWSVTGCNIMLPFESGYYDSYGGEPVSGVLDNFQ